MARRGASSARRIEINRAALDEIVLAAADGLLRLGTAVITEAGVPDAAPYGEGLVEGGAVLAYAGRKKVGQFSTGNPTAIKKPRRSASLKAGTVTVIGGYGFPARFLEEGTAKAAARPFLTPALLKLVPQAGPYIAEAMQRHGVTSAARAARGDTYRARMAALSETERMEPMAGTLAVMARIGQKPGLGS